MVFLGQRPGRRGDQVLYELPLFQAITEGYLCRDELWPFPQIVPGPQAFELYYCATNEEARQLARSCPGGAYLGHDSPDRAAVVQGFRAGQVKRIYCNRMLTEGSMSPASQPSSSTRSRGASCSSTR